MVKKCFLGATLLSHFVKIGQMIRKVMAVLIVFQNFSAECLTVKYGDKSIKRIKRYSTSFICKMVVAAILDYEKNCI